MAAFDSRRGCMHWKKKKVARVSERFGNGCVCGDSKPCEVVVPEIVPSDLRMRRKLRCLKTAKKVKH